jgi:hypothetical protein
LSQPSKEWRLKNSSTAMDHPGGPGHRTATSGSGPKLLPQRTQRCGRDARLAFEAAVDSSAYRLVRRDGLPICRQVRPGAARGWRGLCRGRERSLWASSASRQPPAKFNIKFVYKHFAYFKLFAVQVDHPLPLVLKAACRKGDS